MTDTDCRDFIAALALGEEGDTNHLETCVGCRRMAAVLASELGGLAAAAAAPPPTVDARSQGLLRGTGWRSSLSRSLVLALAALAFGAVVAGAQLTTGAGSGSALLSAGAYLAAGAAATAPVLIRRSSARGSRPAVRP